MINRSRMAILTLFIASIGHGGIAQPQVVSVSPAPQSMSSGTLTSIKIRFDTQIDPASISSSTVMISGRWSGIPPGTFSMQSQGTAVVFVPDEPFSAGEWVTVSISKGVMSAGGDAMEFGYAWNFWIAAGPGSLNQSLIEIIEVREPGEPHIQTYGASAADLNDDGWTDLTLPNEISDDLRVFLNDGAGGYGDFDIHPIPNGDFASTNEAIDLDGDGDFDFAVGNGGNDQMCVFVGDGVGGFESATSYTAATSVRGLTVLDLEGDGDMDIVTANRSASNLSIFYNNGDATFQPAVNMEGEGVQETACAAADANGDGILDLFVGALSSDEMILLLGDGDGGLSFFTKVNAGGSPWMIAVGDVNLDGHVDVVSANSFDNNACVVLGDGNGGLSAAVTYPVGSFTLAIDLGDLDGDGDLDLVTSNYGSGDWTIYENDGTGTFINPITVDASSAGSCATLHDRDNDGDLDMTGIDEIDDLIFIFDNDAVSAPTCADVQAGPQGRCREGDLQVRVFFNDDSYDGQVLQWNVNGTDYQTRIVGETSRGTLISGAPAGTYTISVMDCQPFDVICTEAPGHSGGEDMAWDSNAQLVIPLETELIGNYPNPFNPSTTISYALARDSFVTLKIYSSLGQEVATLVNESQTAGTFSVTWNGTNNLGSAVSSGLYIYRLATTQLVMTEKMILMK